MKPSRLRMLFGRAAGARRARLLGIVFFLPSRLRLFNPYGYQLHVHIYRYLTNRFLMTHINEFASPDFHGAAQKCFAAIVLLSVVTLARSSAEIANQQLADLVIGCLCRVVCVSQFACCVDLAGDGDRASTFGGCKNAWQTGATRHAHRRRSLLYRTANGVEGQLRGHLLADSSVCLQHSSSCAVGGKLVVPKIHQCTLRRVETSASRQPR